MSTHHPIHSKKRSNHNSSPSSASTHPAYPIKKQEATSLLTSPLLGGGYLRLPASLTIVVVTLRALCQEREGGGAFTIRPVKKTREPTLTIDSLLGGGYLLSHFRSTIGVVRLNFSVRNGKRWDPHAMTTLFSLTARTAHLACAAAVMTEKDHRGNARARKTDIAVSRSHCIHRGHRARPYALSFFIAHRAPERAARAKKAFG